MKFNIIIIVFTIFGICLAINNGLGKTPQMGWNTWNHFGCQINQQLIKQTAELMVKDGWAQLGYNYLNLDDCWQVGRDENGYILQDQIKFPSGMKALADYVHSLGLKFGVYSDAGTQTCQGRPGSLGYEEQDAKQYAQWGVDYLKYDNCHNQKIDPRQRYPIMSKALNATGRPIFFSLCEWGFKQPWLWAGELGNSWRTTIDIQDQFESFMYNLERQVGLEKYAGPGGWNDPDMLEVGNGGMTHRQYEAHFSLWALLKAPLILGCDLTNLSPLAKQLLQNEQIISINQDSLGQQGKRIKKKNYLIVSHQIWAVPLSDGSVATVLFNPGLIQGQISVTFSELGISSNRATIRDILKKKDLGNFDNGYSSIVPVHGCVFVRIWPAK